MAWLPSLGPPMLDLAWFPAAPVEDDVALTAREEDLESRMLDVRTAPGTHARVNTPVEGGMDSPDSDDDDDSDDDPY